MAVNIKVAVVNSERMNYDKKLDFGILSSEVSVYESSTQEEILERAQGQEVLVTKEIPVRKELIEKLPDSVKLICEAGTGYNNIDLAACQEKGITVCNIPAYSTQRVAHTAMMLLLNLSSSMKQQEKMLFEKNRSNFTRCMEVSHVEVNGKTLGIIGAGAIGKEMIRLGQAFDMDILVYTRTPGQDSEGIHYTDLETVLKESDYISLHCPLNEKTFHLIDAEALELMKPTASVINTARGALIDEAALITALKEGRIMGAGLDVQETEPPREDNPLYDMENVILTPHMGWKGLETRQRLLKILAENIKSYAEGNPVNVIV